MLRQADISASDPYVVFMADPAPFLRGTKKTSFKRSTLAPEWSDDEVPVFRLAGTRWTLREVTLIFAVMDHDSTSADDPMGQAAIALRDVVLAGAAGVDFDVPVVRFGQSAGRLSGHARLSFSGDASHRRQSIVAQQNDKGCCTMM